MKETKSRIFYTKYPFIVYLTKYYRKFTCNKEYISK